MKYFISDISGKKYPVNEKVQLLFVRTSIVDFIKQDYPDIDENKYISLDELDEYRQKYIEYSLKNEVDTLSSLQKEVLNKMKDHDLVSSDVDQAFIGELSLAQKVADKVATFGGSWRFIISFLVIIILWIGLNSYILSKEAFDPYPFILLNLFLSCLAAFQAPVIMMSQNRQEEKDRKRAKEDYKVNLKSELEIRVLQEKIDHLLLIQQRKMFEVQNIQVEMLKEISADISALKKVHKKE